MEQNREISYRRTISNIFRRLSAEDVQQIAYVRLEGIEDTTKYSASRQTANSKGLDLMQSLQRYGFFSQDSMDGLKDVLQDANRSDLVKQLETETRKLKMSSAHAKSNKHLTKTGREKPKEALVTPSEELAGRLKDIREREQGWVVVSCPERPRAGVVQRFSNGKRTEAVQQQPTLPNTLPNKATLLPLKSSSNSTSSKAIGGSPKKRPLLPPDKNMQEAKTLPSKMPTVTVGQQQPLATHTATLTPSLPPPSNPPLSRPSPPPTPPRTAPQSREQETVTDSTDRDSGLWTGSAADSVAEWTSHHTEKPSAPGGNVSEYQALLPDATHKSGDHQYATPKVTQESTRQDMSI